MDHSRAPVLEALAAYHAADQLAFTPPGHEQGDGRGADVCVTSVHEMGSAFEQSSVFHLQGDLIDPAVLKSREDLLGTASPSVLLYAALDGWRLLAALADLAEHAPEVQTTLRVAVPDPARLRLEQALLPRHAFFSRTEEVPWHAAAGRITAEMLAPYPPGIPAAAPGERLNAQVVEHLRTGVDAGMVVPDAADPALQTIRVAI